MHLSIGVPPHRLGVALCGAGVVPVFGGVAGHRDCYVRINDGAVRCADAAGVYRDEPVCRRRIPLAATCRNAAQLISEYWPLTQFVKFSQDIPVPRRGIEIVWGHMLIMAVPVLGILWLALLRFQGMLERQG